MEIIRLGTRGSDLALWQAHHVRDLLANRAGVRAEIVVIDTQGDLDQTRALAALGSQGVFTKELENALLAREVDVAVHSHKDMPTASPAELEVAAIPARGPIRDGLVVRAEAAYPLAPGAVVGTGSARRRVQLLAARPDLQIEDLRGNVPTRLAKLARTHPGDWRYDAIVLAEAGLVRLGLDPAPHRVVLLDPRQMVPAPAQGALALQIRCDAPGAVRTALGHLHDEPTAAAVRAERAVLAGLRGGCNLPLGCHAVLDGGRIRLLSVLGRDDGTLARAEVTGDTPEAAAQAVLDLLRADAP
jgi:hydroxymethylbilane synthase